MEISLQTAYRAINGMHSHRPTVAATLVALGFKHFEFTFHNFTEREEKFSNIREYCNNAPGDGYACTVQVSDERAFLFCEDENELMNIKLVV